MKFSVFRDEAIGQIDSFDFGIVSEPLGFGLNVNDPVAVLLGENDEFLIAPYNVYRNGASGFCRCRFVGKRSEERRLRETLANEGRKFNSLYCVSYRYKEHLHIDVFTLHTLIPSEQGFERDVGVDNRDWAEETFVFRYGDDRYFLVASSEEKTNPRVFLVGTCANGVAYLELEEKEIRDTDLKNSHLYRGDEKVLFGEKWSSNSLPPLRYSLRKNAFNFVPKTKVSVGCQQDFFKSSVQSNQFLKAWESFSRFEEETIHSWIRKIGQIRVSSVERSGDSLKVTLEDSCEQMLCDAREHNLLGDLALFFNLPGKGNKESSALVVVDERRSCGNVVYCRLETQDDKFYDSTVFAFGVTSFPADSMFQRRNEAFQRIRENTTGIPDLPSLFNGERPGPSLKNIPHFSKAAKEKAFGGHEPTPDQKEAIRLALESPDFMIIQGPPGTGKTRVITAISASLPKADDEPMDLFTAHQNDATDNLKAAQTVADNFPYETITSSKAKIDRYESAKKWAAQTVEKLCKSYPNAAMLEKKMDSRSRFCQIKAVYDSARATTGDNIALLERIKTACPDLYRDNGIEIDELLLKLRKFIPNEDYNKQSLMSLIGMLPNNPVWFEDGGLKLSERILGMLKIIVPKENEDAFKLLDNLENLYKKEKPDFDEVYDCIIRLTELFAGINGQMTIEEDNQKINDLLNTMSQKIVEEGECDFDHIVANYILNLHSDPESLAKAIEDFGDKIFVTHQMAGSKATSKFISRNTGDDEEIRYRNVFIDEAARSNPADLLVAVTQATGKLFFVGDQRQLPQYIDDNIYGLIGEKIMNPEEKALIKMTMFEYLMKAARKLEKIDGKCRIIRLNSQFRMPRVLGNFVGEEFYSRDDEGNELPEFERGLRFAGRDEDHYHNLPGLKNIAMAFMRTRIGAKADEKIGHSYRSEAECDVIIDYLKRCKDEMPTDIIGPNGRGSRCTFGIISFYKAQVNLLISKLYEAGLVKLNEDGVIDTARSELDIQVNTVDAFQGKECDFIFLSTVRSFESAKRKGSLAFLNDLNRLNVAFSRAKKCCILVADERLIKKRSNLIPQLEHFYRNCVEEKEGCCCYNE